MDKSDYKNIWDKIIQSLIEEYTETNKIAEFTNLQNIVFESCEDKKINVCVSSSFYKQQVLKFQLLEVIAQKFSEDYNEDVSINLSINSKKVAEQKPATKKEKSSSSTSSNSATTEYVAIQKEHEQLSREFSFDTFVKCENNTFAYNAGLAISKNPGKAYNPMLIRGGVGVGKTHLMKAIGYALWKNSEGKGKIIYVTAESFMNEFIMSIQNNTENKFKKKYRNADALLIDDIQFLENKEGTQIELFHTFNALKDANKQMIFTCDKPVSEVKNLTERLRSRFEMGLDTDIQTPDYEGRRAILEKKLNSEEFKKEHPNIKIKPEVLDLIANNVETNVRDLIASLTKIIAYTELVNKEVTVEIAQSQLRDTFYKASNEKLSIEKIQKIVAEYYNVSFIDMKGQSRKKNITLPRQIAMYIARQITEYSTTEIGNDFGGRDHTTVIHSCDQIESKINEDPTFDSTIQLLIRKIKDSNKK